VCSEQGRPKVFRKRSAMSKDRISMQVAAEQLGVSEDSIRRYISRGLLTGYRVGPKLLRVDPDEVEALASKPIPTTRRANC
jgi:excisionase family DNA binding protein